MVGGRCHCGRWSVVGGWSVGGGFVLRRYFLSHKNFYVAYSGKINANFRSNLTRHVLWYTFFLMCHFFAFLSPEVSGCLHCENPTASFFWGLNLMLFLWVVKF